MNVRTQSKATAVAAKPPFRAEHIGSLLRPAKLLRERARFANGEISAAELTAAEDEAIRDAIGLQQRLGFKFVTDGEFRRRSYQSFFYGALGQLRIDTIGGADAVGANGQGGTAPNRWRLSIAACNGPIRSTRRGGFPETTVSAPRHRSRQRRHLL